MTSKSPHELDVALGVRIRDRRRMLGLSQEELAEPAGLTFQQIQKYEVGENRISFSRLAAIAGALQCRVAELVDGLEPGEAPDASAGERALFLAEGARELLAAYSVLPVSHRRLVLQHVRGLAEAVRERRGE